MYTTEELRIYRLKSKKKGYEGSHPCFSIQNPDHLPYFRVFILFKGYSRDNETITVSCLVVRSVYRGHKSHKIFLWVCKTKWSLGYHMPMVQILVGIPHPSSSKTWGDRNDQDLGPNSPHTLTLDHQVSELLIWSVHNQQRRCIICVYQVLSWFGIGEKRVSEWIGGLACLLLSLWLVHLRLTDVERDNLWWSGLQTQESSLSSWPRRWVTNSDHKRWNSNPNRICPLSDPL